MLYESLILSMLFPLLPAIAGNECTEGFMDYELLKQKSSQISPEYAGSVLNNDLSSTDHAWRYVMPSLSFTCSGTITGFLLGVKVINNGDSSSRNEYPRIILFNVSGSNYILTGERDIILNANDFSTSGLFNYTLSSPIQYNSNQVLGIYQPNSGDSVVELFYQSYNGQDIDRIYRSFPPITYRKWFTFKDNSRPFVYPITDSNCLNGFISPEDLQEQARLITDVASTYDQISGLYRYYKDIKFSCNGSITHVVIGTKDSTTVGSNPPEIQIWRSTNNDAGYTQSGPSIQLSYNNAIQDVSTEYLRWYNLSEPVSVLQGDIIGVYQPTNEADNILYYQVYNGPNNYDGSGQLTGYNLYPLVSVVFEISTTTQIMMPITTSIMMPTTLISSIPPTTTQISSIPPSTTTPISSNTTTTTSTVPPSVETSISFNITSISTTSDTTAVTITNSQSSTDTSTVLGTTSTVLGTTSSSSVTGTSDTPAAVNENAKNSGNTGTIISGVVVFLIVILVIAIVTVIIVLVILKKRRSKIGTDILKFNTGLINVPCNIDGRALLNPTYGGANINNYEIYETVGNDQPVAYEVPEHSTNESLYSEANNVHNSVSNAIYMYQCVDSKNSHGKLPIYHELDIGLYVPTNAQRDTVINGNEEDIYGKLNDTQYANINGKFESPFFTEEPIYWTPESNTKRIYEQLAQKRYREIPRQEIKITDHLGSGQFGTVDKGEWTTARGTIEVAIKTLKGLATDEEETKFLQEAAINGQFHHPNVVQLCGVVTVGQPVMIVLEYITHGDLKSFLRHLKPIPGQLPDDSLSSLLFKFSHQVACGMAFLSSKRFVHRDLAARNILVNGTVCKIADFGMSRDLQNEAYYTSNSNKIPVKWTAPEALHFRKYSTHSDVWSYGAVLYEIWSVGHKPYEQYTNQECIKLVDGAFRLPSPPGCPRAVYEIMINCWHPVSTDRPSFEYIKSLLSQSLVSHNDDPLSNLGVDPYITETSLYPDLQNKYIN